MPTKKHIELDSGLACNLAAFDNSQVKRHEMLAKELFRRGEEIRELRNGYAFRFPAQAQWHLKIAEWVTLERLCCPFLTFDLKFDHEGGPIWLRLTGSGNVKEFLKTYFNQQADDVLAPYELSHANPSADDI